MDYVASSRFVIRSALLPFGEVERLVETAHAVDPPGALRAHVRRKFADPLLMEALAWASPSLACAVGQWLRGASGDRALDCVVPATRYLLRMAGRPTPFGLFSGCSVGTFAERSHFALEPRDRFRRHVRLDFGYLDDVVRSLCSTPDARRAMRYVLNDTVDVYADEVRFVEVARPAGALTATSRVVAVDRSDAVDAILRAANADEPAPMSVWIEAVRAAVDADVTLDACAEFVEGLIDAELLVPALAASVSTCGDGLSSVMAHIADLPGVSKTQETLEAVGAELARVNAAPLATPVDVSAIHEVAAGVPGASSWASPFHVELSKPSPEATLGRRVLDEVVAALTLLERVSVHRERTPLDRFTEAFEARYGIDEVPLLLALDGDYGIGFSPDDSHAREPAPLLQGLTPPSSQAEQPFVAHDRWLLERARACERRGELEWVLTSADLAVFDRGPRTQLPDAFAVVASVSAESSDALDRGAFSLHVHPVTGPSGAALLGRFAHGDPRIGDIIADHVRAEEALMPEAVFAEIVHLPGHVRLGNVVVRPPFRQFDVAVRGRTELPPERRLALQDLRLRMRGGRLELRSERLQQEVVPRLSTAHNFASDDVDVYRFLCALQERRTVGWSWGALRGASFLPRVRAGRVVLSLARWRIDAQTASTFAALKEGATRHDAICRWRRELRIPRWVSVRVGDQTLPVDLEHPSMADLVFDARAARAGVEITELFPEPGAQPLQSPEGRFAHELVIPFTRSRPSRPRPVIAAGRGAAWTGARADVLLECSAGSADRLLVEVVSPELARAVEGDTTLRWFYERGERADERLRITALAATAEGVDMMVRRLRDRLAPGEVGARVHRFAVVHGAARPRLPGIADDAAYSFFALDSAACVSALSRSELDEERRWRDCILGVHAIATGIFPSPDERLAYFESHEDVQALAHSTERHVVGARFRERGPEVRVVLVGGGEHGDEAAALSRGAASLVAGATSPPGRELADALLEGHVNRSMRARHAAHRGVLFDFVRRHLLSQVRRRPARS